MINWDKLRRITVRVCSFFICFFSFFSAHCMEMDKAAVSLDINQIDIHDTALCDLKLIDYAQKKDADSFKELWSMQMDAHPKKCHNLLRSFYGVHPSQVADDEIMDIFNGTLSASLEGRVYENDIRAIKILLENAQDDLGALFTAVQHSSVKVLKMLLERNFSVNKTYLNDGRMPLHVAADRGNAKIIELLLKYGASIDAQDKYGMTPLYVACFAHNVKAAKCLIWHGASLNIKASAIGLRNETPLEVACYDGQLPVVKLLLERGASTHVKQCLFCIPLEEKKKDEIARLLSIRKLSRCPWCSSYNPFSFNCDFGFVTRVAWLLLYGMVGVDGSEYL